MTSPDIGDETTTPLLGSTRLATPFDRPGTCVYDLSVRGGTTGRMAWTVADVSADESTVSFHYEFADEMIDVTVTEAPRAIADRLLATPAAPFLELVFFPSILLFAEDDALSAGERMTVPTPEGSGTAEVTGRYVHDGLEWYTSVWRYGDELRYTDCMAPETELVLHADYHATGETEPLIGLALAEDDPA